jgi:hypothetical protein
MVDGAGGDGDEKEKKHDTWGPVVFVGSENPVLESLLVYPLVYEVFLSFR